MVILTLNCGSSSVKYQVFDWDKREVMANGVVERVGLGNAFINHKNKGMTEIHVPHECPNHLVAVDLIIKTLTDAEHGIIDDMSMIGAVGHRVVHGGEKFTRSVIVDDDTIATFNSLADLAPLHNPANITGIEAARKVLPKVPHCAVMDTAWHQTMPPESYIYPLPYSWYEEHLVRRYGFHGTSFLYTAKRAAAILGKDPFKTNVIICHIGNGASINAVKDGCSFDTSMGLTPLEGLMMGTRCGDIDPAIPFFMMRKTGMSAKDVEKALNKESGVLGVSQKWADRRDVQQAIDAGDQNALLAQNIEAYRLKKYIGAYSAALGRVDAVVFTAGVGEMNPVIRGKALAGLANIGIVVDQERNMLSRTRNLETEISAPDSPVKVFVIPTDEELVMTEDSYALMQGSYDVHTKFRYSFQSLTYVNRSREEMGRADMEKRPGLADIVCRPKG
jgi:acetate kinase